MFRQEALCTIRIRRAPTRRLKTQDSFPSSPISRFDENCAQITSDTNGKLDGEVKGRAHSCSPLNDVSLSNKDLNSMKVSSITDFFYDDPNKPWEPLPEYTLDQSPCQPIIAIKQNYYYCILHPEIKNVHLESIEHHIKYRAIKVAHLLITNRYDSFIKLS